MGHKIETTCRTREVNKKVEKKLASPSDIAAAIVAAGQTRTKMIPLGGGAYGHFPANYNLTSVSNLTAVTTPSFVPLAHSHVSTTDYPCQTEPKCCKYAGGNAPQGVQNFLQTCGDRWNFAGTTPRKIFEMKPAGPSPTEYGNATYCYDATFTASNYNVNGQPHSFTEVSLTRQENVPIDVTTETTTADYEVGASCYVNECHPYPCT